MGVKTKKPVGVTGVDTKMVEDFYANQNLIRIFCNSLIVKDSHKDTGIQLKNSVLKQAKMDSIYQGKFLDTPMIILRPKSYLYF